MTRYCGGKTRRGTACEREAGWGTSHPGAGKCKHHGGATPNGETAAAKEVARREAARFGMGDAEPTDVLLRCVREAAGFTEFARRKVVDLSDAELIVHGDLTAWAKVYADGQERTARFAYMAIKAGVAERQVRLAERMGELLSGAMERVLDALDLPPKDRMKAVKVFTGALAELEMGDAEVVDAEVVG